MTKVTTDIEETEFKVAAKTDTQQLAKAILTNIRQGRKVVLIVIGHGSIGQALKSIPILNQDAIARGCYYAVVPSFETRQITMPEDQTAERTVMKLKLVEMRV